MHENEIAKHVVDVAFQLHTKLGPGLLESMYHFGQEKIKDGISRVVNGLEDEMSRE